jgi:hypothetical protein
MRTRPSELPQRTNDRIETGTENEVVRLLLIHWPLDLRHDAQASAIAVSRRENRDDFGAHLRELQIVEVVRLLDGFGLVEPLLLEFDPDAHLEKVRESHLQFERMARANDRILIDFDTVLAVAFDLPRRVAPRPGVLTLKLEGARGAFQRLELELADHRFRPRWREGAAEGEHNRRRNARRTPMVRQASVDHADQRDDGRCLHS